MDRRTVFFVSDQTGVTAETMGHSLLTQFDGQAFRQVTLPFISTVDKAQEAVRRINATGEAEKTESIKLDAKGKLQGKPASVEFVGGSVLALRDTNTPYPLDLSASYGGTEVTVKGTARRSRLADIDLTLKGPDMSELFPLLGVPAPPTPPYSLKGNLVREGETWHFTKMQGRIGDSDVSGEVKVDYGPEKPVLTANLVSDNLDFDDLAPLVGAPPDTDETASAEQKKIAAVLKVDPDVVNVKVKSGEGLDAVGREEAIAAQAMCLIAR